MMFRRMLVVCLAFILIICGNASSVIIAQGLEPIEPLTGDSSMSYQEAEIEATMVRATAVTEFVPDGSHSRWISIVIENLLYLLVGKSSLPAYHLIR